MNITVRVFGDFRELLDWEFAVSLPEGATVRRLLETLGERSAALLPKILDDRGQLRPYIHILENGRNIRSLDELRTTLAEDDVVAIFPPLAGG